MSTETETAVSADEMMTVVAARALTDETICFVGIGLPSTAANLARLTHAPRTVLVYESGTIGSKPATLPLSIGDGELAETADAVVPVPEIFAYWLQGGRIDVGFLGAAQIDRLGNLNSTVIGDAPEIAAMAGEVIVIMRQSPRSFVERLDFLTSVGYGVAPGDRERLGMPGRGPTIVITDLGVLRPDPESRELTLTQVHPGVSADRAREQTGWALRISDDLEETEPPSDEELRELRKLQATLEAPA